MKSFKKRSEYNEAKGLIIDKLTTIAEEAGEVVNLIFDGSHTRADGTKVPDAYCLALIRLRTATVCSVYGCGSVVPAGCLMELRAWVPGKPEADAKLTRIYCSLSSCFTQWNGVNQKYKCSEEALCHVWHLTQGVQ
jgi:hypothetical protein